jgi:tetratricopeptide (TPR) repeat protein
VNALVELSRPSSDSERDKLIVGIIAIIACSVRAVYFFQVKDNPFLNNPRLDALFHDQWALSIANGNLLGDTIYFRAPLYPFLLGLVYAVFGHDYVTVRIIQHLLGIMTAALAYLIGRRLFDIRTAVVAALLVSINPMLFYFESQLLFESLLVLLVLLWLFLLLHANGRRSGLMWFAVGLSVGFMSITRPPFLPVAMVVSVFAIWARKSTPIPPRTKLQYIASVALGAVLVIAPVTIRNYVVGNELVLISSQGGVNFYIGNNPDADGISSSMPQRLGASWENRNETYYVEQHLGHTPTPSEESAFWYAKAFGFIRDQPLRFLQLLIKKGYLFWSHLEIPNNLSFDSFKKYSLLLEYNPFAFWLIGPFAMFGGFLLIWNRGGQHRESDFVALFIALYIAITILFFVCDRYRAPVIPMLAILSAHGFISLLDTIRTKLATKSVLMSGGVLLSALIVNSNLYTIETERPAREHFTLGIIAFKESRLDAARKEFSRALDLEPDYPNLNLNLGMMEWLKGNIDEAIVRFRAELTHNADSFESLVSLCQIYFHRRESDSASYHAKRAIEAKPYLASGYTWLARSKMVDARLEEAESVLTRGERSCDPFEFVYGEYLLGSIFQARGDRSSAELRFRSVLQRLDERSMKSQPLYEPEFEYSLTKKIGEDVNVVRARASYGLGHVLLARGALDSARVFFSIATAHDSTFADAYADLGVANLRLRRPDEAEIALHRAVELNPNHHLYWFNYGHALLVVNRVDEASKVFRNCLKLDPRFHPAREILARLDSLNQSYSTP